jgi:hypothetical protein
MSLRPIYVRPTVAFPTKLVALERQPSFWHTMDVRMQSDERPNQRILRTGKIESSNGIKTRFLRMEE